MQRLACRVHIQCNPAHNNYLITFIALFGAKSITRVLKPEPGEIFIRGRIASNTEMNKKSYTDQEGAKGGESAIQRGKTNAVQIKTGQKGDDRRQDRGVRQKLLR